MPHHPFTFLGALLPIDYEYLHLATASFVSVVLVASAFILYPRVKNASKNLIPQRKFGLFSFFEIFIEVIANLCHDIIGHGARKYIPFIATVFFFILAGNAIGLVPGFLPTTDSWVPGAAVATIVFLAFNYFGFRENGISYFKHFMAPISIAGIKNIVVKTMIFIPLFAFQILFAGIETISMAVRPITLSIRLFLNVSADHMVLGIFSGIFPYLLPLPFMVLGLMVAILQAFIFTLLTMVYVSLAVAHDH